MADSVPRFIEPMLLVRTDMLPSGPAWRYELKLDGYRALAFKSASKVRLVPVTTTTSRNDTPAL